MTATTGRATLALITAAAIVAAVLAAHLPAIPPYAAAMAAYGGTVWALARATNLPPARVLAAVTLLVLAALALALTALRHVIDAALWALAATHTTGLAALRATTARPT